MWNSRTKCTEIGSRYFFSIYLSICQFVNNFKRILNFPKLFEIRIKSKIMKTFHIRLYHFENIGNMVY